MQQSLPSLGGGTAEVTVSVLPNTSLESRSTTINAQPSAGGGGIDIKVTQQGILLWGNLSYSVIPNSKMDTFTPSTSLIINSGIQKYNTLEENGNEFPYPSFTCNAIFPPYFSNPTGSTDSSIAKFKFIAQICINMSEATVEPRNLSFQQYFIDSDGIEFGKEDWINTMVKMREGLFGNCSLFVGQTQRDWGNQDKLAGTSKCVLRICSGYPLSKGNYQILAEYIVQ